MVHCRNTSANGRSYGILRVLITLSLILLAFPMLAQDALTPAELEELEQEKRNKIIFYVASGFGIVAMIGVAWLLGGTGKSKKSSSTNPTSAPGMRTAAGRTNDPYMRRKVVKRTS